MFNNCNPHTNGEVLFFNCIQNNIKIIFDVGCREDSEFTNFQYEVHYFDPVEKFIQNLSQQSNNKNSKSIYNAFGLSNKEDTVYYYPKYQSFYDRINSCKISDDENKIKLKVITGKKYITEKKIDTIDFLKIDTEGYEMNVLEGFEEYLKIVKIIQFEYGGTFLDNNVKLIDIITYLEKQGFYKFAYLSGSGTHEITNYDDHYQYCNIVCINKNSDYIPY